MAFLIREFWLKVDFFNLGLSFLNKELFDFLSQCVKWVNYLEKKLLKTHFFCFFEGVFPQYDELDKVNRGVSMGLKVDRGIY